MSPNSYIFDIIITSLLRALDGIIFVSKKLINRQAEYKSLDKIVQHYQMPWIKVNYLMVEKINDILSGDKRKEKISYDCAWVRLLLELLSLPLAQIMLLRSQEVLIWNIFSKLRSIAICFSTLHKSRYYKKKYLQSMQISVKFWITLFSWNRSHSRIQDWYTHPQYSGQDKP